MDKIKSLVQVNGAGVLIRGISKNQFFDTVPEFINGSNNQLAEKAWDLWKQKRWGELEELFNLNNLNNKWPPNDGFTDLEYITLKVNFEFDRYGGRVIDGIFSDNGKFVASKGSTFESRALPPDYFTNKPYRKYKVIKEIPNVGKGKAIPWFGQGGLGIQYKLQFSVDDLIKDGYIISVN